MPQATVSFTKTGVVKSILIGVQKNTLALSFLKIKPTGCTNFSNLFWNRTGYADCLLARSGWILISLADSQHNLYDKYLLLCVHY